jgi:hypothetical protein
MIGILLISPFIIVESTEEPFFDEGFKSHLQQSGIFFIVKGFGNG